MHYILAMMQAFGCDRGKGSIFLAAAMEGLGTDVRNKEFSVQAS
jgi:hypothetical protein